MDGIQDVVVAIFSSQITHTGIFFTIAAWLHAGRVKKEIKTSFTEVVGSIDKVAIVLREDLAEQGKRIGIVEHSMDKLVSRVTDLETKQGGFNG